MRTLAILAVLLAIEMGLVTGLVFLFFRSIKE
jgi:hypothetical protein